MEPTETVTFRLGNDTIQLQISDTVNGWGYRLIVNGSEGKWTGYSFMAVERSYGYVAFSPCYEGEVPVLLPMKLTGSEAV